MVTQIICNVPTETHTPVQGGLFNMAWLATGWYIHDMLICGNNTNPGPGIVINLAGGTPSTGWRIERITSMMEGHGIVCADTNTATIKDFRHWPGDNRGSRSRRRLSRMRMFGHGIYCTGSFVNNISMINPECLPDSNYNSAMCGIKCDAAFSLGCTIIMPIVESGSGNNNETGIDWIPKWLVRRAVDHHQCLLRGRYHLAGQCQPERHHRGDGRRGQRLERAERRYVSITPS